MANVFKTQLCPECGGVMRLESRGESVTYKGNTRVVQVLGWWCTAS